MYEILMIILAVAAVIMAFFDLFGKLPGQGLFYIIDLIIWGIFVFDYLVRLIRSKNRKEFIAHNIFDLISILPFSSFLRIFRLVRLFKLARMAWVTKITKAARLFALFGRFGAKLKSVLQTNGFIYVLYVNMGVILLGGIGIYIFEGGETVYSFPDALWWSFVTATTVGYGDISPATGVGRIIAVILMLIGIGTIGMLTSSLSTYFIKAGVKNEPDYNESIDDIVKSLKELSPEQISFVRQIINNLKR